MKKAYIYPASPESKLQLLELRFAAATHIHRVADCLEVRTLTNLWQQQQRSKPVITDESIHTLRRPKLGENHPAAAAAP